MHPFFGKSQSPAAAIFGAADGFAFERWISAATEIKIALAFGHTKGWELIYPAIKRAAHSKVQVLLGQAFFQTEPALLLELKKLNRSNKDLRARLASSVATFHPKVWVAAGPHGSQAIVGSSNLSGGGLRSNVECNIYLEKGDAVAEISRWFDDQWASGHDLEGQFFEDYIKEYNALKADRLFLRKRIEASQDRMAGAEAKWRKREALKLAIEFWTSQAGQQRVRDLEKAIASMRKLLNFPGFRFGEVEYEEFAKRYEFGWIRLTYLRQTKAELPRLRAALAQLGKLSAADAYDELDKVYGIGPNLGTKFLAIFDPERFVVVNGPVERALLSFGYSREDVDPLEGKKYERLLAALEPFIEEALSLKLRPAAALDAFFYHYRGS